MKVQDEMEANLEGSGENIHFLKCHSILLLENPGVNPIKDIFSLEEVTTKFGSNSLLVHHSTLHRL